MPSFERGAVLLRASDGHLLRLTWEDGGAERTRRLAPGKYELVGYRLLARAADVTWHVAATATKKKPLVLEAERVTTLEIDPTITVEERVQRDGLQVAVLGQDRAGLSIYRAGKRIPLAFRRLGEGGAVRGEGKITYG